MRVQIIYSIDLTVYYKNLFKSPVAPLLRSLVVVRVGAKEKVWLKVEFLPKFLHDIDGCAGDGLTPLFRTDRIRVSAEAVRCI